jgi:class 3 adenylate cyclase
MPLTNTLVELLMKWIDSLIAWMSPSILVEGTPWRDLWVERERRAFVFVAKIGFPVVGLAYVAHYYFYDLPNGLEPIENWMLFRFGIAAACALAWLFYVSPLANRRFARVPAMVVLWTISQSQAFVAVTHGMESWVFCFVLVFGCALFLRVSAMLSLVFACICISTQAVVLVDSGFDMTLLFTGTVVTLALVVIVRTPYLSEVRYFILNQENLEGQRKLIELNVEFSERIRSFIPRVIARRLEQAVEERRVSIMEASIDVMSPQKKYVSCLFSDIRGFTQGSKDLEEFVLDSVIPEVKACSDAVEDLDGIPRKIGDLVFAYFDQDDVDECVLRSFVAALEVARRNQEMNSTLSKRQIRRYVLLASGKALVGNLGSAGSSIEITALGSPVNLLSRIDEATKHPELAAILSPGDLVLSEEYFQILLARVPSLDYQGLDLRRLGVSLRDFGEITRLVVVQPSEWNYELGLSALRSLPEGVVPSKAGGEMGNGVAA